MAAKVTSAAPRRTRRAPAAFGHWRRGRRARRRACCSSVLNTPDGGSSDCVVMKIRNASGLAITPPRICLNTRLAKELADIW